MRLTCPITNLKLKKSDLSPNISIKSAIYEWKAKANPNPGEWRAHVCTSPCSLTVPCLCLGPIRPTREPSPRGPQQWQQ